MILLHFVVRILYRLFGDLFHISFHVVLKSPIIIVFCQIASHYYTCALHIFFKFLFLLYVGETHFFASCFV